MQWNKEKTFQIVTSLAELEHIRPFVEDSDVLAFDTETDGLRRFRKVVGVSFAWSEDEAIYIPLKIYQGEFGLVNPWDASAYAKVLEFIKFGLTKKIIGHNAVFDVISAENELKVNCLDKVICDTQLLAHTVYNEEGPLKLKELAATFLDRNANAPQDEVRESVKANGGSIAKTNFEMYKCRYDILGKYCCYDAMYTFGIYNRLYPEIDKQGLRNLWEKEVLALLPVTYALNTNGIKIDVPYFENLKLEMESNIDRFESEIYNSIKDRVAAYELEKAKEDTTVTARSEIGKQLVELGLATVESILNEDGKKTKLIKIINENAANESILNWYKNKKEKTRIFNLSSGDDKAFLLYEVLNFECPKTTKTGKASTDSGTIESLLANELEIPLDILTFMKSEEIEKKCREKDSRALILKLLLDRAAEQKLLNTYVEPLLECHIEGVIYTGFNQTGTTGGRYSSSEPINLQTLPREDKRIKKGFIAGEGCIFVADDFESLEPKGFAAVSGEDEIKRVYSEDLDLYSKVAIDTLGIKGVTPNPKDKNYLKNVYPDIRQLAKTYTLAIPYGCGIGRLAQVTKKSYEEAKEIYDAYMSAYPKLKKWMDKTKFQIRTMGYVKSIVGRKRRAPLVYNIYKKYNAKDFTKREIEGIVERYKFVEGFTDAQELFYACRNNFNNSLNFQIQSLAASITNAAMIDFLAEAKRRNLKAKLILMVHDEIIVRCPLEEREIVAQILQKVMENNWVTKLIDVKMKAVPAFGNNLAEAK